MAAFLGSGSTYLSRTFEPCYDRFDCEESDDELRFSSESVGSQTDIATLDEVGYSFTPFGGIILHSKKEKVEAVYKKIKVPKGTVLPVLGPKECGICMTDIEDEEFVVTECGHQYCRQCLGYYVHLQSGDIENIQHVLSHLETTPDGRHHLRIQQTCGVVCPYPTCSKIIEGNEFKALCSEDTWDRFNHLSLLSLLRKLERAGEVVSCPLKCGGFIQNCLCTSNECRQRTLYLAEQERIRLYKAWRLAETRGMELLRQWASMSSRARQCPKCSALIEKNGGCDHMYCTFCKTHYNWSSSSTI